MKIIKIIKNSADIEQNEFNSIIDDQKISGANYIILFVGNKEDIMWQYIINSDKDIKRELIYADNLSSIDNLAVLANIQFIDLLKQLNKEDWENLLGIGSEKC